MALHYLQELKLTTNRYIPHFAPSPFVLKDLSEYEERHLRLAILHKGLESNRKSAENNGEWNILDYIVDKYLPN